MTTAAVFLVKDEVDVIEGVIRHAVGEVDFVLVADNGSTDGTREILDRLASELPVTVQDQPGVGYYQSRYMSALAEQAAEMGADWLLPSDADEIWYSPMGRIREALASLPDTVRSLEATLYNHFCTSIDPPGDDPFRTMQWRKILPGDMGKVAFRWEPNAKIHQGNHGVTLPSETTRYRLPLLELRHFPYRSPEHMVQKARNGAAAYKAAPELPESMGIHWRSYGEMIEKHGEEALKDWFRANFWYFSPADRQMIPDPAPYRRWENPPGKKK